MTAKTVEEPFGFHAPKLARLKPRLALIMNREDACLYALRAGFGIYSKCTMYPQRCEHQRILGMV